MAEETSDDMRRKRRKRHRAIPLLTADNKQIHTQRQHEQHQQQKENIQGMTLLFSSHKAPPSAKFSEKNAQKSVHTIAF
jgi:hypothetical protein